MLSHLFAGSWKRAWQPYLCCALLALLTTIPVATHAADPVTVEGIVSIEVIETEPVSQTLYHLKTSSNEILEGTSRNLFLQKSALQWIPKKWSVFKIHDIFEEAPEPSRFEVKTGL